MKGRIYIPSDRERAGSGEAAAYTGLLLGICTDVGLDTSKL